MRIETQTDLASFFNDLANANIEIPDNLTFEIDSEPLKLSIEKDFRSIHGASKDLSISFMRGEFMGVNFSIKQ